ncbi:hypothetical protein SNE40_019924 [Patella caerulea]|uniref:Uncharacterized protein n=1 Tax=Patella caerulea TaxID=87958 RepID=A0AAN8IZZ8_PATCE
MSEYLKNLSNPDKNLYSQKLISVGITDPQANDPFLYQSSWLDDVSKWPMVDFGQLYVYLIDTPGIFTRESMKTYKSLEAYNQYESGWVQTCFTKIVGKNIIFKAKVNRSQAVTEKPHEAWVCVNNSDGSIITGHCTCMAGQGSVCSHVAAILFKVEACGRLGFNQQLSCTSVPCMWNQNYTKKVTGDTIHNINFKKPKAFSHGSSNSHNILPLKRSYSFKDPQPFLSKLKLSKSDAVIFTITEPKTAMKIQDSTFPPIMDQFYNFNFSTLSDEQLIIECENTMSFLTNNTTSSQIEELSKFTCKQRECKAWYTYRKGRLTASNFHEILHTSNETLKNKSLLKRIMQYSLVNEVKPEAIQWGIAHEKEAIDEYFKKMCNFHSNFTIEPTGFHISLKHPYLGASPDGLTNCDCCGTGIIEVKCPFSQRYSSPCQDPLSKTHKYFTQIQGQMYVLNLNHCDFIVWTPKGLHTERIFLDNVFCKNIFTVLKTYFSNIVLPELLTKKFFNSTNPSSSEDKMYCFCGQDETFDNMIGCDSKKCKTKWYHMKCVGLNSTPEGMWVCLKCRSFQKSKTMPEV